MKVGDIIKVLECLEDCICRFCYGNSNRIGIVMEKVEPQSEDPPTIYNVQFDVGPWTMCETDIRVGNAEVVSESR